MATFISPWASYDPDEIPDLMPRDKEDGYGCIGGVISFVISTIVFICAGTGLFQLKVRYGFSFEVFALLTLLNAVVIYPLLMIFLTLKGFKIASRLAKKKDDKRQKG